MPTKPPQPEPLAANAFRMINDGERLAIHRVHVDDSGAVVAWEPDPVCLEQPACMGVNARMRLSSDALGAALSAGLASPVLLLRDGKLIEIVGYGGENAEPVRDAVAA